MGALFERKDFKPFPIVGEGRSPRWRWDGVDATLLVPNGAPQRYYLFCVHLIAFSMSFTKFSFFQAVSL